MENDFLFRIRSGDEEAFTELVNKYNPYLYAYAISLTKVQAQAQDIVQNTFLNLWANKEKLNLNTKVRPYLYRCIYNEFIDQYRKDKTQTELERLYHDMLHKTISSWSDDYIEKKIAILKEEIEKLPKQSKEIFLLSKSDGFTNQEIAEVLNLHIKSVEYHISKSYKILRKKIGERIELFLFIYFARD